MKGSVKVAKCILCGKETGDKNQMCRNCAEEITEDLTARHNTVAGFSIF